MSATLKIMNSDIVPVYQPADPFADPRYPHATEEYSDDGPPSVNICEPFNRPTTLTPGLRIYDAINVVVGVPNVCLPLSGSS